MKRLFCLGLALLSLNAFADADSASLQKSMEDTLKDTRCVPHVENGKPAGYKCFQNGMEVTGETYEKGAVKNSEVISELEGKPTSPTAKKPRKITIKSSSQAVPQN